MDKDETPDAVLQEDVAAIVNHASGSPNNGPVKITDPMSRSLRIALAVPLGFIVSTTVYISIIKFPSRSALAFATVSCFVVWFFALGE